MAKPPNSTNIYYEDHIECITIIFFAYFEQDVNYFLNFNVLCSIAYLFKERRMCIVSVLLTHNLSRCIYVQQVPMLYRFVNYQT